MPQPRPHTVELTFKVNRRIAWDGETDVLKRHVDDVCASLEADTSVEAWELHADLDRATLTYRVIVTAETGADADATARAALSAAIRGSGGCHDGLLPLKQESQLKADLNAWWGLRTPKWQHRGARVNA